MIGTPSCPRRPALAGTLAAALLLSATAIAQDSPSPDLSGRLEAAYQRAGANREAIQQFVEGYDGERRTAAEFLVVNSPPVDLVSLSLEDLRANLDLAFAAWKELPWAASVPQPLFLHYVLPHRVTQEAFEPWRPRLYEELHPALHECHTMVDVALAVNRWCGARIKFKQTEFRDQNTCDTLRAGYGRCEEMMIACITALRTMGLPARPCSTPWWVVQDNNHAWVEVWADGQWYYLGGCEPAATLDAAWFTGPTQRAGAVISQMFGDPRLFPTGEVIYRQWDDMGYVNSTGVYSLTGALEITVRDAEGQPAADCPVAISCFNYGGLRPLLGQRTDPQGQVTLVAGMGSYFLSAGDGRGRAHAVVTTSPDGPVPLELKLAEHAEPPLAFWLRYPTVPEARRLARRREKAAASSAAEVVPELPAPKPLDLYDPDRSPELEAALAGAGNPEAWRAILKDAWANWSQIAGAVLEARPEERSALLALLEQTTHLDRIEVRTATLLDHLRGALASRAPGLDEELFRKHVLAARVDLEHITPWRSAVAQALEGCRRESPAETAAAVAQWCRKNVKPYKHGRLGPFLNPGQTLRAGVASDREAAIFLAGALRALGVPARKTPTQDRVEYHDGESWQALSPRGPAESSGTTPAAGEERPAAPGKRPAPGTIRLLLTRDGKPVGDSFTGADVARFDAGAWQPLRGAPWSTEAGEHVVTLPPGEYLVTAGVRNANGDPWIHTAVVQLTPGKTVQVAWALDLPPDSGVFQFPVARPLETVPTTRIRVGSDPSELDLADQVQEAPLLLVLVTAGSEPCQRMLPLVAAAHREDLADLGVQALVIRLPGGEGDLPDESLPTANGDAALADALGLPREGDGYAALPSVLLLRKGGKPLLWVEGYDLEIGTLLRQAARQID